MKIKRSDINLVDLFGKDRAQEDSNLKHYFVKTKQYEEIKNGEKELVLGRKGSGKSALFSMLAEEAKASWETIPVSISFDGEDFVYIERWLINHNFSEKLNDDFKYSLAWKDFIVSEIIYTAITYCDIFDDVLKQKLIQEGVVGDSSWKRFAKSLIRVIKGGNVEIPFGKIELDFSGITSISQTDKDAIQKALNELMAKYNFLVVIDNLDEPWKNNNEMNSWLRGLIFSIRQLKRSYNNLKIVAFLRTDIYEIISKGSDLFDSKSEITTISWDDNNYFSLKQLVAARIAHYFNLPLPENNRTINDLWNIIFPINFHYNGRPNYLSNYMIDRTFQRPRELLQFCRLIFEKGKTIYLPIEENAVSPAEIEYSSWKLIDLSGEYSKSCRNLDNCIESFIGVRRHWTWTVIDLQEHINKLVQNDKLINAINGEYYSTKECIEVLYRVGFLRKVISMPGKRTKYRMYYQDNTINYTKTTFDIHPAFRKRFTTF